ncbi:MAG: ribonuclease P protein component [bacterium]|nr:ribonuclease P protein component [Patescibacteria group bacterium]MDW8279904.1 ribonuclease P protein component [bacterium]
MIKKKYRINFNYFNFVSQKPIKIIDTPYFKILIFKNNVLNNRYGVFFKKGIIKKSTQRNKIKRIFFSEINKIFKKNINLGLDFVIKPKLDILNISLKKLREKFKNELLSNFDL